MTGPTPHHHGVDLDEAFDFLNTRELESGAFVDHLETVDDVFEWIGGRELVHSELLDRERAKTRHDEEAARRAVARVRRVRDALRELTDAVVEGRAAAPGAIAEVNRALRAREVIELEATSDGVRVGHRHVGDPIDDALARLADPIVHEISGGRPDRLRVCADDSCRWIFYDASPTGRRRWCSMASCGNRAKAARHRARKKAEAESDDRPSPQA
ncbi:MAG TPA: CGNR zinc finger domain-containing protein [Candidatus Limnocylindrales bacterium]|jgi:predicted RNA-binding Zn ribbon-like protein